MLSSQIATFLLSLGGIILVDLILSGDNALVIGAAAAQIHQRRQRWLALIFGGLGAILLRILFTTSATFLLGIPYLQAIGGLLVLVIAIRLLFDNPPAAHAKSEQQTIHAEQPERQLPALAKFFSEWTKRHKQTKVASPNRDFLTAIVTIIIADVTMSLDNIVAIGALAHQQIAILVIGLSLSIALLIIGSALAAELLNRLPWLIIVASFILAWVSSNLVWNDVQHLSFIHSNANFYIGLLVVFFLTILVILLVTRLQRVMAAARLSR